MVYSRGMGYRNSIRLGNRYQADWWVPKLLSMLGVHGLKPGLQWGKEFYSDMIKFLTCCADLTQTGTLEIGLRIAVQQLTRERDGELLEEEVSAKELGVLFQGSDPSVDVLDLIDLDFEHLKPPKKQGDDLEEVLRRGFG